MFSRTTSVLISTKNTRLALVLKERIRGLEKCIREKDSCIKVLETSWIDAKEALEQASTSYLRLRGFRSAPGVDELADTYYMEGK